MDKNKNRTDLLAAGRKRLQQFRKKKDGKGNKSSTKASNSEIESDADSRNVDNSELLSPQLSGREGSSRNDFDSQNDASSIPSPEDHIQITSIDDPSSAPIIPENDLDAKSLSHNIELLPEEPVLLNLSVGNDQDSDSLASHHVENINVVEEPSENKSLRFVNIEGDSIHSDILDLDDSSKLKCFDDTNKSDCGAVDVGVDGADQVTDIGAIQGGDHLPLQDEQSKIQSNFDQERGQLVMELSSATNSVSEVGQKNESLCEELAKCKSDLEAAFNSKNEIEKQFYSTKSEVVEITMRAEELHLELERSNEASTRQLAEIAECKNSVAALQAEIDTLNRNLTFSNKENDKLLTALAESKDSLKLLQVEHAKLNDTLMLTSEERRNLEEAKNNISSEKDKLLTELEECKVLVEVFRVENDKLNANLFSEMKNKKEIAEEKSHFASESEKLSRELVGYRDLLAGLQSEHEKALDELKEAKSRLEKPSEDNIRSSLPRDGQTKLNSAQLKDPAETFVLIDFKGHLEEVEKLTQILESTIEEIHSHSMLLSTSSREIVAPPVSKLVQAFESKALKSESDEKVVSSNENKILMEYILLAKKELSSLRTVFKELICDSKNAIEFLEVKKNSNLACVSVSYEAPKEHCDSCEETSIENIVLYEFVKRRWSDIEAHRVELLALYDTMREKSTILEIENINLVSEIGVTQTRAVEFERKVDEMISSHDELVFSLTKKVDDLCKEITERDLKNEQIIQLVRQLGAIVGSRFSTLDTVHDDLDLVGYVGMCIDSVTSFIKNLQENLEACKIDHKTVNSSHMDMIEKCNDLGGNNEIAIGLLLHLRNKLDKLVTASDGLEEYSQIIEQSENLVDPPHLNNYVPLIEQITSRLKSSSQLESENNKLRSELIDRENNVEELKKRCLDSDAAILHLIEDVEATVYLKGLGFNSDKLESRLHYLISLLLQKYKEVDDQLHSSRETSISHENELSMLQGQIENLSLVVAQHENEILILKESLWQGNEVFMALQAELHGKLNELEQSEQRVSSIKEKLSIAVSKGKGLIVQRDNLKQSLAETSNELEKYMQELESNNSMLEEVETKLMIYSEAGERVEALESELSYIRNSAAALRESFLLKDSVLQRIEEILEDLELPENFHSRDIIEKVDWLARSVTGNALPFTDWDQKSSYTDSGFVSTDAWKEDMQQTHSSDDDLIKKYEELQSKFYGLAEQNEILEQSLMERNNVVQRWEEISGRINMPLELRSMEPEDRIESLANALSEALQKVDYLENYCTELQADLDQSQTRLSDLDTALQAVTSEKERLLQSLNNSTSDYDKASQMVAKLECENNKLQNEITVMQGELSSKVQNCEILNDKMQNEVTALQENLAEEVWRNEITKGEIRKLEDLISGEIQSSIVGDVFTSRSGTEYLEQLLRSLVEQYTILSLQKNIVSVSEGEKITEEAGAINVKEREKEDIGETDATASRQEFEEALICVEEERDRYMEINQSLVHEVETLELKRQELQELLSQEEQKSASVREKLNVAVRKGKSLVLHRDSLKQAVEEMNNEVERLKSEIKNHEVSRFDYEQKMKDLSSNKERVEVLESENMRLKNLVADTEYSFQEKTHMLNMIVDILNGFDVSFENASDPVEKLNKFAKKWQDLHVAMTFSENNFDKAKRSAELLLAELNEVQERNDVLQEELSELYRERDFAEASKQEAILQLEKFSSIHHNERNNELVELIAIKKCLTELTKSFYGVIDLVGNVLSKEVEYLYNLEMNMKYTLEPSSENIGGLTLGEPHNILSTIAESREKFLKQNSSLESEMQKYIDDNRPAEVCGLFGSQLQVFLKEVGVMKEKIYKNTITLDERAKQLSKVAGIICKKLSSQKQSLGSMTDNSIRLENIEKQRDELRKNISLLFEACCSSVLEIENWKSQFVGTSLIGEDIQKFDPSIDNLSSEECIRTLADRLLFSVRGFIRIQTETIEGGQKDMKTTITNLQKELQEKERQKEKTCMELVNQIREVESTARNHLQDSQSAKAQLDDVKKRLEVMEEDCDILKERVRELEDGQSNLKELDERERSLKGVLVAKEQEIEALMQALDEEETQIEDLTNKNSELERVVQQKNTDLENLQASRAKVMKKLSITVSKFDEIHHLSDSLLSEVENLQSQVHERDEEISFLRQEVTRCANDALLASQMSNKRNLNEMYDIMTWLNSVNSGVQWDVEGIDDYKELLQKQIRSLLSQMEDLRAVIQSKDVLLQVEKTKVEDLMRKGESLENTLRKRDSQLSRFSLGSSGWMESSTSEIVETEPLMNKWAVTGTSIAPQVRTLRKVNNDQVAIAIDPDSGSGDKLEDEDDDKAHGFKSLTTSRIIPRFSRPLTDMIDGLWVSCDRTLMRQPALRLGVIIYWAVMHALLAAFVV